MNLGDWPLNKRGRQPAFPVFSWCGSENTRDIIWPTWDLMKGTIMGMDRWAWHGQVGGDRWAWHGQVGGDRWVGHGQVGVAWTGGWGQMGGAWTGGHGMDRWAEAAHCNKGSKIARGASNSVQGESENETGEYDLVALFPDPGCL